MASLHSRQQSGHSQWSWKYYNDQIKHQEYNGCESYSSVWERNRFLLIRAKANQDKIDPDAHLRYLNESSWDSLFIHKTEILAVETYRLARRSKAAKRHRIPSLPLIASRDDAHVQCRLLHVYINYGLLARSHHALDCSVCAASLQQQSDQPHIYHA